MTYIPLKPAETMGKVVAEEVQEIGYGRRCSYKSTTHLGSLIGRNGLIGIRGHFPPLTLLKDLG